MSQARCWPPDPAEPRLPEATRAAGKAARGPRLQGKESTGGERFAASFSIRPPVELQVPAHHVRNDLVQERLLIRLRHTAKRLRELIEGRAGQLPRRPFVRGPDCRAIASDPESTADPASTGRLAAARGTPLTRSASRGVQPAAADESASACVCPRAGRRRSPSRSGARRP